MTIPGLTRTLVPVVAAGALIVSASPTHAQGQPDGPDFGAPTVGACSTMTAAQARAQVDKSAVVACSQAHTAKVAGVVRVPDSVHYSDGTKLYRVMVGRCEPQANEMLGRTAAVRDSSAYAVVWFIPSKNQRRHGARWVSCAIVLRQGAGLAKLPTDKTPMLPSGRLGDGIHRCLLADISHIVTTRCSGRHGWRATGAFVVASTKFPGTKALNHAARGRCKSRTQKGRAYRWTYWTKVKWQVGGDHAVICYSKTSR